jgi:recombinational DNA repair protein RecR
MNREKIIKEYEDYVNSYISLTTSHDYEFEMHKAVLALLKEQNADIKALKTAYKELAEKGEIVVRCKDCKHFEDGVCEAYGFRHEPCFFCADGERKD